jgi:hypothetical protein
MDYTSTVQHHRGLRTFLIIPDPRDDSDVYERNQVHVVDSCEGLEQVDFSRDKFGKLLNYGTQPEVSNIKSVAYH